MVICVPAGVPEETTVEIPAAGETPNFAVSRTAPFFYISYAEAPVLVSLNERPFILMDQGHGGRMDINRAKFMSTTGGAYTIRFIVHERPYQIPFNLGGAGEWERLALVTHTSGPSITLKHTKRPEDYSVYKWLLSRVEISVFTPAGTSFEMRVSTNRGASFHSALNHRRVNMRAGATNIFNAFGATGENAFNWNLSLSNLLPFNAQVTMLRPGSNNTKSVFVERCQDDNKGAFVFVGSLNYGFFNVTGKINAAQFRTRNASENLTNGRVEWWGLRAA